MKVYIVEAHSYDEEYRLAVCASIDKAKEILKAEAEDLVCGGCSDIDWYESGLGFYDGTTRYHIAEAEVLQ